MAEKYKYDPETKKWSKSSSSSSGSSSSSKSKSNKSNKKKNKNSKKRSSSSGNLTSSTGNSKSSKGSTEKKYNKIEINTLVGRLEYIVTENTIKITAGDTITLKGLGKYLSGKYYVKDVTHQVSSSGYSHSATVIKTDFGETLKSSSKTQNKDNKDKNGEEKKEKSKKNKKKIKLTKDIKMHVAAAILAGSYGWGSGKTRKKRVKEVFGANSGILAIVHKGKKYVSGYSPAGYSYKNMKKKKFKR